MKKVFVLWVCLCFCMVASYAQKGESAVGANLNFAGDTGFGLGLKYRYGLTENLRLEPAFNGYFKHNNSSMWDLGANLHYVVPVANQVDIYPLGGLAYANATAYLGDKYKVSDGKIAVNLGAGVDFKLASVLKLNLELKYQIVNNYNQLVLAAGVAFTL